MTLPTATLVIQAGEELASIKTCSARVYPLGVHFALEQVRWETGTEPRLLMYEEDA